MRFNPPCPTLRAKSASCCLPASEMVSYRFYITIWYNTIVNGLVNWYFTFILQYFTLLLYITTFFLLYYHYIGMIFLLYLVGGLEHELYFSIYWI